jgi:iron complex outermembrane receptor protein
MLKLQNLEIGTGRLGFSLASNIANTKIDGKIATLAILLTDMIFNRKNKVEF